MTTERVRLEVKQAENGQRRPDAKEVAALWANFLGLWQEMTEEERTQVMGLLVERVDILTKEEGTCKIRFSGQVPISSVVTTQTNRAGDAAYHELSAHQNRSAVEHKSAFFGAITGFAGIFPCETLLSGLRTIRASTWHTLRYGKPKQNILSVLLRSPAHAYPAAGCHAARRTTAGADATEGPL